MCWNLATDKFFYKLKACDGDEKNWTKRKILSKIGKMYDPSGYLGPVIIRGKMIIQNLWKNDLDWDQSITGELKTDWTHFNQDLENVKLISVNRWLGTMSGEPMQLHGFCDASEKGYGAVIYSRVKVGQGYRTEIISSKSKVAPLKATTIPRLELCAANLLVNLLKSIIPIYNKNEGKLKVFCWSDSQIVLLWLTKASTNLKTYVANRVANIQTISEESDMKWNWIKGEDNPADLISRGLTMMELSESSKWWNGPKWLNQPEKEWPSQSDRIETTTVEQSTADEVLKETKPVVRSIYLTMGNENELIRGPCFKFNKDQAQNTSNLLDTYGEWTKLHRVTTKVFEVAIKFENLKPEKIGKLEGNCEKLARDYLIRKDQERTFQGEIQAVKEGNKNALARLVLTWDPENKFLRIDGRVRSDNLTQDEQFPIVLSKGGALAPLLIRDAHYKNGHAATQWILQYLRQKY